MHCKRDSSGYLLSLHLSLRGTGMCCSCAKADMYWVLMCCTIAKLIGPNTQVCPENNYKDTVGTASCTPCPGGFSIAGSTAVGDCKCNAGSAGVITTSGGTCTDCQPGTYSAIKGKKTNYSMHDKIQGAGRRVEGADCMLCL